jgi:uncharacterized membrane protein
MYAAEVSNFPLWWLFPLIITLCLFMMRSRRSSMMCGFGSREENSDREDISDSAKSILDKRYARGEIDKEEYEMKKRTLNEGT